jgi:hypothetical protein
VTPARRPGGARRRAAAPAALLPRVTLAPLAADDLPDGTLARIVAASPPEPLLRQLYGRDAALALAALALTDPVLHRSLGGVHLVQPADWPAGPGAGWILAPFVRAPGVANATRFSDGRYGVWYGAESVRTALAEVGHHLRAFLAHTQAAPDALPRTILAATPDPARGLVDLRGRGAAPAGVLDPDSYAISQPFGATCRAAEHWGLVWPSVRRRGGTCVGVLRPPALSSARVAGRCVARWDGTSVTWE